MSKSTWSKGRLSVRLSHVCETDCNRFLLDKESTGCTDRCNRTKIPEHANSASAPAWEADVLLNYEHLFFVQKVDGEERFPLLFSVQRGSIGSHNANFIGALGAPQRQINIQLRETATKFQRWLSQILLWAS